MQTKALSFLLATAAIVSSPLLSRLHAQPSPGPDSLPGLGRAPHRGSSHRPPSSLGPTGIDRGSPTQAPTAVAWHPRQHAFRAAASLEEILQRSNLVDIVGHVEANWNLVETDAARAYDLIEAASLRYHHLATRPSRPSEALLEIRVRHGRAAVDLHRLLERINPARGTNEASRARLETLQNALQSHAAAAAVAMALRQLAFTDWSESTWDEDRDADIAWTSAGIGSMGDRKPPSGDRLPVAERWVFGAMLAVGLAGLSMATDRLGPRRSTHRCDGGMVAHDAAPAPPF